MRAYLRARPWIWIVLFIAFFMVVDFGFVIFSCQNPPTLVK